MIFRKISVKMILLGLLYFCYLLTALFSDAFLPENESEEASYISGMEKKVKPRKSSIVIEEEDIIIDEEMSGAVATSPTHNIKERWWSGFETAYSEADFLEATLERIEEDYPGLLDKSMILDLFMEEEYKDVFDTLKEAVPKLWAKMGGEKERKKASLLYTAMITVALQVYDLGTAEDSAKQAISYDKDNQIASLLLGETYARQGRFGKAEDTVRPLLSSGFYPVGLSALMSRIYQHKGQIARALDAWEKVHDRIEPDGAETFRLIFLNFELQAHRTFHTYSTVNYEVKYDPAFEKRREKVLTPLLSIVDEARWKLNRRFRVSSPNKTVISLYGEEMMRKHLGMVMLNLEGFYSFQDDQIRIGVPDTAIDQIEILRPVIFHEYVHRLTQYKTRGHLRLRWFHEGLATWYEWKEGDVDRFENIRVRGKLEIDPDRLMKTTINTESYYKARLIMEFMMEEYGESRIMRFLETFGQGKNLEESSKIAFNISFDDLKDRIREKF